MTTPTLSFGDAVSAWCRQAPARLETAFRRSVDMLAEEMQHTVHNGGRLPHRTGNLMRSLLASTAGMPPMGGDDKEYAGQDLGLVTASLKLGDTIWLGYQANYARRMNFGFVGEDSLGRNYNQSGYHFVEHAAAQWPQIVARAAKAVQAETEAIKARLRDS